MKRVGMFVWNHFTNDARVMRECTTLSNNGFMVDLICIDNPKDPNVKPVEKINDNFHVYRLKRYPTTLILFQKMYRFIVKRKWLAVIVLFIWALFVCQQPIVTLLATLFLTLLTHKNVKKIFIRSALILRMIGKGYRGNYDIYHANDLNTLVQGYISSKWRWKKRPLVYDSHEVQTSRTGYGSPWYGRLERFLVKRIDKMIVENHTRATYNEKLYGFYPTVLHNYPSLKLQYIPGRVNLHKILQLPENDKILLYQGGIQQGRGLENLVKAFPLFREGTLLFIGDGRLKDMLIKQVKDAQLDDKIHFLPKVPLRELPKYTKNAFLGFQVLNNVCFNHWSASSNKLFEYIMCEVPVVSCNFPEIKRVVEENKVGVTVDSHDPLSIAEGVNFLLEHPDIYKAYKANCKKAREKYNWEREEAVLLNLYRSF